MIKNQPKKILNNKIYLSNIYYHKKIQILKQNFNFVKQNKKKSKKNNTDTKASVRITITWNFYFFSYNYHLLSRNKVLAEVLRISYRHKWLDYSH